MTQVLDAGIAAPLLLKHKKIFKIVSKIYVLPSYKYDLRNFFHPFRRHNRRLRHISTYSEYTPRWHTAALRPNTSHLKINKNRNKNRYLLKADINPGSGT